jgi:hypothetical protein
MRGAGGLLGRAPDAVAWRRLALELEMQVHDADGARKAAAELESRAGTDLDAWLALEHYYASVGDRGQRVRAGEHFLRLGGDPAALEQGK